VFCDRADRAGWLEDELQPRVEPPSLHRFARVVVAWHQLQHDVSFAVLVRSHRAVCFRFAPPQNDVTIVCVLLVAAGFVSEREMVVMVVVVLTM